MTTDPERPLFSIIIPAHNEAGVIRRNLSGLEELERVAEIIVVANGCTDDTVEEAASLPWVSHVLDVAEPSKIAALNAGDRAASHFPRIYLDADIGVTTEGLESLARELSDGPARVASLAPQFDTDGRPWLVRAFYRAFERTPYVQNELVGLGLYGVNASGHARIAPFPAVLADDLYVQRSFAPDERITLRSHTFTVATPRSLRALVSVRTRVARGNAHLASGPGISHTSHLDSDRSSVSTIASLLRQSVRHPSSAADAIVFVAVNLAGRCMARAQPHRAWERDMTTR